jgi:hypothetical protein
VCPDNKTLAPLLCRGQLQVLPFVASCFGRLGLTAIRFLAALAQLELERHDQWLATQGLDPLVDPSVTVRAQLEYRQLCFRHSSAPSRLGHALAKATVMRLLATPSLPSSTTPSRVYLARNRPGQADSLPSFSLILLPFLSLDLFLLPTLSFLIQFFSAPLPIFEHLWPSFLINKSCNSCSD